jgi:hypothetical protein
MRRLTILVLGKEMPDDYPDGEKRLENDPVHEQPEHPFIKGKIAWLEPLKNHDDNYEAKLTVKHPHYPARYPASKLPSLNPVKLELVGAGAGRRIKPVRC